ncbi:Cytochrome c heme lyase subunit CcmH [Thioalkalivibrio nitratireducens DSM 14787]|uniref:Cytochrome c heme lyase subunit CcmH n=1 Tax=Thioalkalivibrio nitratireducens (strain DSM 14787 / UNIQEM 213 / ALEN2) TaxID=1255043 RepID=L0DSL7_THIND|nr:c-type cytochrome biogenesis protein CcmI [Thioalkalivibrio nitratireducens]AGA31975.1 Cytochrome c heme lyase subunit CcmH [Thioalkalivibrio nitratireducens DSM 14787]
MNSIVSVAAFWSIALLILALVLLWVLPPLFRRPATGKTLNRRELNIAVYRDQYRELESDHRNGLLSDAQLEAARSELEARLAQDALTRTPTPAAATEGGRGLAAALLAVVPALALGGYLVVGDPGFIMKAAAAEQAEQERQRKVDEALARLEEQVDEALASLEEAVREDPDDGLSWTFLANAYIARDRWDDAEAAYERAYELLPDTAVVVSGYAEALAVNADRDLRGRPMELVRDALALDPEDPKGLEMAGLHAYQNQEYGTAAYYWNQLLRQMPEGSPAHGELTAMVRQARGLSRAEAFGEEAVGSTASITGRVELAPDLAGSADPGDTVYLFARTITGSTAPLAALRTSLDQLPVTFTLDDSLAMTPDHVLSNHESITLVARVSRHGDAQARPGDLEGVLESVEVGAEDVRLVIDTVRP